MATNMLTTNFADKNKILTVFFTTTVLAIMYTIKSIFPIQNFQKKKIFLFFKYLKKSWASHSNLYLILKKFTRMVPATLSNSVLKYFQIWWKNKEVIGPWSRQPRQKNQKNKVNVYIYNYFTTNKSLNL